MRKLIVANWKLNPDTRRKALLLARHFLRDCVVLCPPAVYLEDIAGAIPSRAKGCLAVLGAQDVFWEEKGAYTGGTSPRMLKHIGAEYVITGHVERRRWFGDTDVIVNKKTLAALRGGLRVILCVGEPLSIRKKGAAAAKRHVAGQLARNLRGIRSIRGYRAKVVIAYEPIWAIGTGVSDDPESLKEMVDAIKKIAAERYAIRNVPVLYGGSVTQKNAARMLQWSDGALVGGASLRAGEFRRIIHIAHSLL